MNSLLFRVDKNKNYVEVRSTEEGYKIKSFMPEAGERETNYYDNEFFSKETKWSEEKLLKHADFEQDGLIESIEDKNSKVDLMPGLLEADESIKDNLKEAYLKSKDNKYIIQFKFQENMDNSHKMLFSYCIVKSFIKNKEDREKAGIKINDIEIQILKEG